MRLYDRQGRVRERALTMLRMRGEKGKGDRTLLRFTYPNDIRNTSFLVWEHPGAVDDERFLYLPALGRVRRIAGQEKDESFVGSDLSYEDIGGRDIADHTYAFTADDTAWTAPDGTRHPAWLLESKAKDPNATLPRAGPLLRPNAWKVRAVTEPRSTGRSKRRICDPPTGMPSEPVDAAGARASVLWA